MSKRFHPILYSTPMVQAILEGRKTKTRRTKGLEIVNDNPDRYVWLKDYPQIDIPRQAVPFDDKFYYAFTGKHNNSFLNVVTCPYGKVGDILWVRETSTQESITDEAPFKTIYKADVGENYPMGSNKWKPSIFMPKSACRIFLEITDIKIERLQDISEEDAKAEGVEFHKPVPGDGLICFKNYTSEKTPFYGDKAKLSFKSLWQKINGPKSLEANPFVWVISFKQIDKPENFN